MTNWDKDWGPYWLRHAGGMAWIIGMSTDLGVELPASVPARRRWIRGTVLRPGRRAALRTAAPGKGGVTSLSSWFKSFAMNGDMDSRMIDFNVFQAGTHVQFRHGGWR